MVWFPYRERATSGSVGQTGAGLEEGFLPPFLPDDPQQSRGVMPFSLAYFAADSSIIGRTIAWSEAIQSVITFHFLPSHWTNFTAPPPSWSMQDTRMAARDDAG